MGITTHNIFCQSLNGGRNDHVVFRIVRHSRDIESPWGKFGEGGQRAEVSIDLRFRCRIAALQARIAEHPAGLRKDGL